jgi:hypothetical protein
MGTIKTGSTFNKFTSLYIGDPYAPNCRKKSRKKKDLISLKPFKPSSPPISMSGASKEIGCFQPIKYEVESFIIVCM